MRRPPVGTSPPAYRIRVQGCVDPHWSDWFSGLTLTGEAGPGGEPTTVLTGPVPDQPALRGILNRLWDLNLTLLTVERLAQPGETEPTDGRHLDPRPHEQPAPGGAAGGPA